MRVRFLKSGYYEGFTTTVVDGIITIEDSRYFFELGQNVEIQDFQLAKDGLVDIIFLDNSVCRAKPEWVELTTPTPFIPNSPQCCKK